MEQEKVGKARIIGYGIGLAPFLSSSRFGNFWSTKNGALKTVC
jgi:hypothetical protein